GNAGFCFTFARTGPAPQSASLPITMDGEQWLVGSIRLDGRQESLRTLRSQGYDLSAANSDEELTLYFWRHAGPRSGAYLLGDFAFGIWEPKIQRFTAARDIIGAQPLFYAQLGRSLLFTNTLEVLRLAPEVDLGLDEHFVADFLLQGWCAELDRTIYRGVR